MDAQAIETLFLSAITVAELRFGVAVLPAGKRRDRLAARLEQEVLPLFADLILPFDLAASQSFATLMASARAKGRNHRQGGRFLSPPSRRHTASPWRRANTAPFVAAGLSVIDPWATL